MGVEELVPRLGKLLPMEPEANCDVCSECGARAFDDGEPAENVLGRSGVRRAGLAPGTMLAGPARRDAFGAFGLDFTPPGSEDGFGILTFCSRTCLFAWARKLLAEVDRVSTQAGER